MTMRKGGWSLLVLLAVVPLGCTYVPPEEGTMDDPTTQDPALERPEDYVLSARYPNPTEEQKARPVVVTAHGFQASSYEWVEFRDWAEARGALVSLPVLGGHGRSTEAWVASTWAEWGQPILDEYQALAELGYTRISIFCSSTGCPLSLDHMAQGRFDDLPPLESFVMVAPFLAPQNELLYNAKVVGPVIGNLPSAQTDDEKRWFYHNRPWPVFNELLDTITAASGELEEGITLPAGTRAVILRADAETTVAPESADKILAGLHADEEIELVEYPSEHHIFTRRNGRLPPDEVPDDLAEAGVVGWDEEDDANYEAAFARMGELLGLVTELPAP